MEVDTSGGPGGVSRLLAVEAAVQVAGRKVVEGLECVDKGTALHTLCSREPILLLFTSSLRGVSSHFPVSFSLIFRILSELRHPHIVTYYDSFFEDTSDFVFLCIVQVS